MSYADMELEIVHTEGELRWPARVYFVVEEAEKETALLGHQGFFEYFTATFSGDEFALDLEANPYLPKVMGSK